MPGTLLLDCEGLSKLYHRDRQVVIHVEAARQEGIRVGTTAMTRLEAEDRRLNKARITWVLSRLDFHEITRAASDSAADLFRTHQLHGHKSEQIHARAFPSATAITLGDRPDAVRRTRLCQSWHL